MQAQLSKQVYIDYSAENESGPTLFMQSFPTTFPVLQGDEAKRAGAQKSHIFKRKYCPVNDP